MPTRSPTGSDISTFALEAEPLDDVSGMGDDATGRRRMPQPGTSR